jgi:hypothetical protein
MHSKARKRIKQEPIKFNDDDIDSMRCSVISIYRGNKIRYLTNGEKLVVGLLLIGVKKAKIIVDIRKENEILEKKLIALIKKRAKATSNSK